MSSRRTGRCDRSGRLRPRRGPDPDGGALDEVREGHGARGRRAVRRGGAARDDGDELAGVVGLYARARRPARVARRDRRRGRPPDVGALPGAAPADRRSRGSGRAPGGALATRSRLVLEPGADRPRPRALRLDRYFRATVSSEEVARGKPAPDVYLEACRRLEVEPAHAAAVEDTMPESARPKRPGCGCWPSPTRPTPRTTRRSQTPMSC